MCLRVWENYDVRALSVQRVDVEKAIAWAELMPRERRKHFERINGAWYLTDVKQFLEYFSTQNSNAAANVFCNLIDCDVWTQSVRERQLGVVKLDESPEKILQANRVAQLTQNVMAELETALLSLVIIWKTLKIRPRCIVRTLKPLYIVKKLKIILKMKIIIRR